MIVHTPPFFPFPLQTFICNTMKPKAKDCSSWEAGNAKVMINKKETHASLFTVEFERNGAANSISGAEYHG